jgi:hypothetical protein
MRRLLKFMHTMGAIGLMGAMACLLVLFSFTPAPTSLSEYALMREAMGGISTWIFLPSLGLTLIAGLLAIGLNRAYHNAGWAWVKLLSGVLVFEWGFAATLAASLDPEWKSLWVMLAVATVNVILGIWRPRLTRLPD